MRKHEIPKAKAQLKDLYERWQCELGDRFFQIYANPSAFKHLDAAEMRKCLKFSPILRAYISRCDGDIDLASEMWGRPRDGSGHLPFKPCVNIFRDVPGTVDEAFSTRPVETVGSGSR